MTASLTIGAALALIVALWRVFFHHPEHRRLNQHLQHRAKWRAEDKLRRGEF